MFRLSMSCVDRYMYICSFFISYFFFFKQKTAYEMRISDWSSDVCSSDLKKLDLDSVREFRDRFNIPVPDDKLEQIPYFKPSEDSPEMKYLHERRKALGGFLPHRRQKADEQLTAPALDAFKAVLEPTADGREISNTPA